MESRLQRFQRGAASRPDADKLREVVAAAIGAPHRILIGAGHLPGHIVDATSLICGDRHPATTLSGLNSRVAVFQLAASAAADAVMIENVDKLELAGRYKRLDGC